MSQLPSSWARVKRSQEKGRNETATCKCKIQYINQEFYISKMHICYTRHKLDKALHKILNILNDSCHISSLSGSNRVASIKLFNKKKVFSFLPGSYRLLGYEDIHMNRLQNAVFVFNLPVGTYKQNNLVNIAIHH